MTPPKSLHGSLESLETEGRSDADARKAPLDLVVENNWVADEDLGEVTGEPTKEHWKVSIGFYFLLLARVQHATYLGHLQMPFSEDASIRADM